MGSKLHVDPMAGSRLYSDIQSRDTRREYSHLGVLMFFVGSDGGSFALIGSSALDYSGSLS